MRRFYSVLLLVLVAGCDDVGRYQIAPNAAGSVWRVDTKTGEIAVCAYDLKELGKLSCGSPAR